MAEGKTMKTHASRDASIVAAILLPLIFAATAYAAPQFGYTQHDQVKTTKSEALAALETARTLSKKNLRTGTDIIALYHAEEKIGAFRRILVGGPDNEQIIVDCESYVSSNNARFREVNDGWKGENNYFEPNSFWADALKKVSPNAIEVREIDFDLKFKDLVRSFRHDERALGKDCATFYSDLMRSEPMYAEGYSKEEISSMAPSCMLQRKEFSRRKDALLKEFSDIPAAKKLETLDPTEIVSEIYFGLC